MNNGIKVVTSAWLAVAVFFALIFTENIAEKDMICNWEQLPISVSTSLTWELDKEWWETELLRQEQEALKKEQELLKEKMKEEIENISFDSKKNREEWYIEYKKITNKYPKEFSEPTIYDTYSSKELNLLFRIVQAEVGDYGFIETANVVSVIFNRHYFWNKSLTEVLTAKNQFSPYLFGTYKTAVVDEQTKLACEYVFLFGDTTSGCIGFRSDTCPKRWNGWEYRFSDEAHYFYK